MNLRNEGLNTSPNTGAQIENCDMGRACVVCGEEEKCTQCFSKET